MLFPFIKQLEKIADMVIKEDGETKEIYLDDRLLLMDSCDVSGLYILARAYLALQDYKNALEMANRMLTLKTESSEAYVIIAQVERKNGSIEKAISTYKKALSYASAPGIIHWDLANC